MKLMMYIEYEKCIGCHACTIACKLEHNLPPYPSSPPDPQPAGPKLIRVIHVGPEIDKGRVRQIFTPMTCKHCAKAPCIENCPEEAITKSPEGVTLIDGEKCIGCGVCLEVCPFGAPQMVANGSMMVCNLCIHRIREGLKPACVSACPAQCIHVGTVYEISEIKRQSRMKNKKRL